MVQARTTSEIDTEEMVGSVDVDKRQLPCLNGWNYLCGCSRLTIPSTPGFCVKRAGERGSRRPRKTSLTGDGRHEMTAHSVGVRMVVGWKVVWLST